MKTITIDVRMLNASGIGVYIRNLVPGIMSACADVKFILLGNKSELYKVDWTNDHKVDLIECNAPIYSISEQLEMAKKVPESDLFWSPHYNIPMFPVRAKRRLVTIHDVFHLAFFDQLNIRQKIYAKFMLNSAVNKSDGIITVSNFSKSEIIKYMGLGKDKIKVIHNGIDAETFRILDRNTLSPVMEKFGLPEKFILYVGNIKPHKNLKRLLGAYELLINKGVTDYHLVIVGNKEGFITDDSELFRFLEDKSSLQDKVLFTGNIENTALPAIYNSASMMVFPSLYEGFGLPPLEAMACGCPVVVSNIASLPEVCGNAAYYVDPRSVESIAEGMHKVLTNESLRQSLIKRGLGRVNLFTWEKSAEAHVKAIAEVLNI